MARWHFQWPFTLYSAGQCAIFGVPGISVQSPILDVLLEGVFGLVIGVALGGFVTTAHWRFQWLPILVFALLFAPLGAPGVQVQSPVLDAVLGVIYGAFVGVTLGGLIQDDWKRCQGPNGAACDM